MNKYKITAGTPEGFDWVLSLSHKNAYTEEEFNEIAEVSLMYAMSKEKEKEGYSFKCSIDRDFVMEYLKKKGFVCGEKIQARYDFEPYWGKDNISKKFLKFLDNIEKESDEYLHKKRRQKPK